MSKTVHYPSFETLLFVSFLASFFLWAVPQARAQDPPPRDLVFSGIGAGESGQTAYRTVFTIPNSTPDRLDGTLNFWNVKGEDFDVDLTAEWTGESGLFESEASEAEFQIPGESSLIVTLQPSSAGELGWAQLRASATTAASAVIQVAELPPLQQRQRLDFEHYISQVANVLPSQGSKSLHFPVWAFFGFKNLNTAFSVVNLAGAPADVIFELRTGSGGEPIVVRRTLDSGEMIADYFDRFWEVAVLEIFPFELRGSATMKSSAPLALSVLQTIEGLPAASIGTRSSPELGGSSTSATLGEEFELAVGDSVQIEDEDLRVELWNIVADSRCPTDVVCVWEGELVIELLLQKASDQPESVQVSTQMEAPVRIGSYEVEIVGATPAPISTQDIPLTDYRVTILLTRASSE